MAALAGLLPGAHSRWVSAMVYPPSGLSGGMFYAIKLIARRMRLMRDLKSRYATPLRARCSSLARVATSSGHQLGREKEETGEKMYMKKREDIQLRI